MIRCCPSCGLEWHHPVANCINCGRALVETAPVHFRVIHVTRVEIPSSRIRTSPTTAPSLRTKMGDATCASRGSHFHPETSSLSKPCRESARWPSGS